jgi:hypothetical protein
VSLDEREKLRLAIERAQRALLRVTERGQVEKQGTISSVSVSPSTLQTLLDVAKEKYDADGM